MREKLQSSTLKFFVDVQGKTKLETNIQAASLLPHYNTFEARAMRVVISDLPPKFSTEEETITLSGDRYEAEASTEPDEEGAEVAVSVTTAMDLLASASDSGDDIVYLDPDEGEEIDEDDFPQLQVSAADIEAALEEQEEGPSPEQIRTSGNGGGAAAFIGNFVFNTVTSLYVGEKLMIEMPTWFFPGGAGTYSQSTSVATHGEPSPAATFRFAEPIFIDRQQPFRVEIEVPDSDVLRDLKKTYGPLYIWVVLDGYMTRGVQ
jgi:hypothetical protein